MAIDSPLMPRVPDDVLIEIFLKLPVTVRSLLLCMSVSKHWLSLIQNPSFITLFNSRPVDNPSNHNPLLVMRAVESNSYRRRVFLTFLSDDETLAYKDDVALDVLIPSTEALGRSFCLLGPCNGMFCMTKALVNVYLINPATRKFKEVVLSPRSSEVANNNTDVIGFGFDPVCNDYKIVRFFYDYQDDFDEDHNDFPYDQEIEVHVFSLSTNHWRELGCVLRACRCYYIHGPSVFFNGACHWLLGEGDFLCVTSILVFDLNKETFNRLELHDSYLEVNDGNIYLSVLDESLAIILQRKLYGVEFEIWVMEKYGVNGSWSILYNFTYTGNIRPLSFGMEGELLLEKRDIGQLLSFNFKTRIIRDFNINGVPGSALAFRYGESLVSLK